VRRRVTVWLAIGAAAATAARLRSRLVAYEIADHSMEPALRPGDWVLGVRGGRARPGDVVVFDHPHRPGFDMVKRVAGPGEQITGPAPEPGELWVLGDNPAAGSVDSRFLGPIPRTCLRARLLIRYRPGPPSLVR
jgi:signal peptidase I